MSNNFWTELNDRQAEVVTGGAGLGEQVKAGLSQAFPPTPEAVQAYTLGVAENFGDLPSFSASYLEKGVYTPPFS